MTVTLNRPKIYTSEEYLNLEISSDIRNEYRNGEIIPIRRGTPAHNQVISALNALLWFGLRSKPYSIFMADQRLWIPDRQLYTYRDGMVIKNPVELQSGRKDTVTNPLLFYSNLAMYYPCQQHHKQLLFFLYFFDQIRICGVVH